MNAKPNTFLITVALLILAATGLFIGRPAREPAAPQGVPSAEARALTVTAEGTVKAKPDVARGLIGIETQAPAAVDAQESNARKVAAVIDRLRSLGLGKDDIHTIRVELYPISGIEGGAIRAFRAVSILDVAIPDPDDAGAILDGAVAAGATSIHGVSFGIKDDSALMEQAMALAVKNARAKADQLATAAKVTIKGIRSISVAGAPQFIYPGPEALGAPGGAPAYTLPGEATVRVTVTVTFSF